MNGSLSIPNHPEPLPKDIKVPSFNLRLDQPSQSYFGQLPEMTRAGQGRFTTQRTPISDSSAENNCVEVVLELDYASEVADLAAIQDLLSMPLQEPAEIKPQIMRPTQSGPSELSEVAPQPETSKPLNIGDPDNVNLGVQPSLDFLAGMAHELSQQKLSALKTQEALDHRSLQVKERELRLAEQAERLQQLEQSLHIGRLSLERDVQAQAASLSERRTALQVLEEAIGRREHEFASRVERLSREEQRVEQQAHLLLRAIELDEREIALQRLSDNLAAKSARLVDAKNRLGIIVKSYSEKNLRLVRGALSAIDKTIFTELDE
ncbi:hypothetical protein [Pseudomonas sp. IT-P258]|uniref:hypothetical protein n=1 Tax=Pseudomonas sp. IT-P258 TaxID=3026447 RepID=UPI0039E0DEAB